MNTSIKKFNSISDIRTYNRLSGKHFFDASSMRFFNSKVYDKVYKGNFFITSERFDSKTARLYTVRIAMNDGRIETIPKFQAFKTKKQAIEYIQSLPTYLPEAYQYLNDCFKNDNIQEFINTALIEPVNSETADYTRDSFTGSCSWLCDHSFSIDDSVLKRVSEDYTKQLEDHINDIEA